MIEKLKVPQTLKHTHSKILLLVCLVLMSSKVFAQLVPNFSANITSGCAPLIVQFTDLSTGAPTQWKWDLGNGTLSTQQNPIVTYFIPGSYTVKLVIQNGGGKDSITKVNYIIVNNTPTVNFSNNVASGCYPLKVQFTDLSTANSGTIVQWTWDFGDGTLSSLQSPLHTYVVAGNFGVTLQVKNSAGCTKILNKPNLINILGGVKSNFTNTNNTTCGVPATVNFNNTSTGTGVLSFQWNFGDGGTSTLTNPINVYTTAGTYTVTLITINNQGCRDTLIRPNYVSVGAVSANFTNNNSCVNTPINFTNTSTPTPGSVFWNFGDGTTSTVLNPIKTYSSTGTFQVKMVANFGICKDSIIKNITVLAKPTSSFTQSGTTSCIVPFTVNFTNTSTGGVSYKWLFGDAGTSTELNPSHTYNTSGIFDVFLIATNALGCTDTLKKIGAVKINPPNIKKFTSGAPFKGCAPYTSNFAADIDTPEPIALYQWNFGDATPIVNGSNPTHTYTNTGFYNITLMITTINGCKDTFTLVGAVQLDSKPTPNFSATPRNACAQDNILFTSLSSGTITSYLWNFGDGGSSTAQNPIYNYVDTGYFTVTLIVINNNCKDSIKFLNYIYINPPVARFIKTFNCDTPLQRRFFDQSIGATTYTWDFGDGTFSNIPNPVHTFPNPGLYIIKLTVTNGTCTHFTRDSTIITSSSPNFTTSGATFCKYANVVFTATNVDTNHISNYIWNFGDGVTLSGGNLPVVTHAYLSSGNVIPSLITTDIVGCKDTVVQMLPITLYGPKAGFANNPGTCINGIINFIDTSKTDGIHPIQQWIWSYGDGLKDTLSAPPFSHQYNATGTFTVKLTVKDAFGCADTLVKPAAVLITKPIANFAILDTIRCANSMVQFSDSSNGVNLTYQWNFGDNTTSSLQNPSHAYADTGYYSVMLKIVDLFGCTDSVLKPQLIHVVNSKSKFSFLIGDTLGLCYPYLIQVINQSTFTSSISWSFGDASFSNLESPSHFYNYVGTYPLTLRAYGFGGCVDSTTKNITVRGPTGTFTYTPLVFCNPNIVTFTAQTLNNATFVWDFNDGVIVSTSDSVVTHNFQTTGLFKPKMILVDAAGCQVPITGADTIRVADIETHIKVPQTQFCDSVRLNFLDSTIVTNDNINSFLWKFGDGTTSTLQHPQHFYSAPGNYIVTLKVTSNIGCTDTDTLNVPINIVQTPLIRIVGDSVGCVNTPLTFNGIVVKSDSSAIAWSWNFNNNTTSTLQNPLPTFYSTAGNYIVTAISKNASGCADTATKNILIHPTPNVNAGLDSFVCRGSIIVLQATGASSYIWSTDATLSCLTCANPSAKPDSLRLYRVTGTNNFGCSAKDSVYIDVIQRFKVKISKTDTICVGESTQLLAKDADTYLWTPTTGLNNPNIPNPIARPTITTTYSAIGSDNKNCFKDTATVIIKVYPIPQFNIIQSTIQANVGAIVPILTTSSADIIQWKWMPDKWLTCDNCPSPSATIHDNIKYIAEASNLGGCKTRDEVTIEALCTNANIFIPNTFSPNGDGANDVFYPRGKGLFKIKSLRVFNRWGEIVFSKTDFFPNNASNGWDGSLNGIKLNSDVYVYTAEIICDNNQIIQHKGDITLIR